MGKLEGNFFTPNKIIIVHTQTNWRDKSRNVSDSGNMIRIHNIGFTKHNFDMCFGPMITCYNTRYKYIYNLSFHLPYVLKHDLSCWWQQTYYVYIVVKYSPRPRPMNKEKTFMVNFCFDKWQKNKNKIITKKHENKIWSMWFWYA